MAEDVNVFEPHIGYHITLHNLTLTAEIRVKTDEFHCQVDAWRFALRCAQTIPLKKYGFVYNFLTNS